MSENEQTGKYHPSPAKKQKRSSADGSQTDGASQAVAGSENRPSSPNVLKEQEKTEKGYRDLRKGQRKQ